MYTEVESLSDYFKVICCCKIAKKTINKQLTGT